MNDEGAVYSKEAVKKLRIYKATKFTAKFAEGANLLPGEGIMPAGYVTVVHILKKQNLTV